MRAHSGQLLGKKDTQKIKRELTHASTLGAANRAPASAEADACFPAVVTHVAAPECLQDAADDQLAAFCAAALVKSTKSEQQPRRLQQIWEAAP